MRLTKDITLVTTPAMEQHPLFGRTFHSYVAIARELKIGETVTVRVMEGTKGDKFLAGFGEVSRESKTDYTEPRRLAHDF